MSNIPFPFDNNLHELKLGNSFDPKSKVGYHSIRYDFKPASVDTGKEAHVEISNGSQVTVTVPHVEDSSTSHTVFKGNKQPSQKECVLIIDHNTGTYTLEKLSSKISVKKSRLEGSSKAQNFIQQYSGRITPTVDKKNKKKKKPSKEKEKVQKEKLPSQSSQKSSPEADNFSITPLHSETSRGAEDNIIGEITDSSSDDDLPPPPAESSNRQVSPPVQASSSRKPYTAGFVGVLNKDLELSASSDESDSD